MTANQINYWRLKEDTRAHLANEGESRRHNLATEGETRRTNLANESIKSGNLLETIRHNVAGEEETRRSNLAKELETNRHNLEDERVRDKQASIANFVAISNDNHAYNRELIESDYNEERVRIAEAQHELAKKQYQLDFIDTTVGAWRDATAGLNNLGQLFRSVGSTVQGFTGKEKAF